MWMPRTTNTGLTGHSEISGKVIHVSTQPAQQGFLGGRSSPIITLRVETGPNQEVDCKFEGNLQCPLIHGDLVLVRGYIVRGVLNANYIQNSKSGAIIGQTKCFVATVVLEEPNAPELSILRNYRDTVLCKSLPGIYFIRIYSKYGPHLANYLHVHPVMCLFTKNYIIQPVVFFISKNQKNINRKG